MTLYEMNYIKGQCFQKGRMELWTLDLQ